MDNRSHKAIIRDRKEIAEDTYEMTFELENPLIYKAGQYLWVELEHLIEDDPKGNRRAFSITNPPAQNETTVQIIFRKQESGFKKTLLQLSLNSPVNIIAPFGSSFVLPEDQDIPIILLSAGTGVGPFLCLIRDTIQKSHTRKISLLYYEETAKHVFYQQEIKSYHRDGIETQIFDTRFQFDDLQTIPDKQQAKFYLSGPQEFIDLVHAVLTQNGILESQLVYEANYPTPKHIRSLQSLLETHVLPNEKSESVNTFFQNQIFRMALDTSSSHIVITDLNGVIRYANKTAEDVTGFRISEMIGQTPRLWGALMPPNFYQRLWDMKIRRLPITEEITNRRKNGDLYTVILHVSPINDLDGSLIGFMATEEDITILRNREAELASLSDRFLLATSSANIGTWEWDIVKDKIISERTLFKLYGVDLQNDPRGAFVAWQDTLDPDGKEHAIQEIREVIQNPEKVFDTKYKIITPNGEKRTLRSIANVERDESGRAIKAIGVNWDITREENVDRAKSEFVSLASHELRTPITIIRWYAEMLMSGNMGNLNDQQKNYLQEIYKGNKHLVDIVNALLDVSRMELGKLATKMKIIHLSDLIQPIIKDLQTRITEKHLSFRSDIDPSVESMHMDPKLIEIVLQNLITNAVKYTPLNGTVTFSANLNKEKTDVIITIEDSGVGIPSDEHPSIFSKLYRASNVRSNIPEGTGLGLYLTKSIIDHTGGKIWFESEENKGSAFHVSYPVTGMEMN